jgi:hypothetical protein
MQGNDCIDYLLLPCVGAGHSDAELDEAMPIAPVGGGSSVIPPLRHAVEPVDLLRARENTADMAWNPLRHTGPPAVFVVSSVTPP